MSLNMIVVEPSTFLHCGVLCFHLCKDPCFSRQYDCQLLIVIFAID